MSKWQCYSDQKTFLGITLQLLKDSVQPEEKELFDSTQDTWAHMAPEASPTLWKRIFELVSTNFHEIEDGGIHERTLEIYNSRYKEFRDKWYNDNTD